MQTSTTAPPESAADRGQPIALESCFDPSAWVRQALALGYRFWPMADGLYRKEPDRPVEDDALFRALGVGEVREHRERAVVQFLRSAAGVALCGANPPMEG